MSTETKLFSVAEAARSLGVTPAAVRNAMKEGRLSYSEHVGRKMLTLLEIEEYRLRTQPIGQKKVGRPRKNDSETPLSPDRKKKLIDAILALSPDGARRELSKGYARRMLGDDLRDRLLANLPIDTAPPVPDADQIPSWRVEIPMELWGHCMAQPDGASPYICGLIAADMARHLDGETAEEPVK